MTAADVSNVAHISAPAVLRDLKGWLIWRYEPNDNPGGKPRKVPYYVSGARRQGVQGTPEDREQLATFAAARAAAARRGFDGVGFAPQADFGIVALDFDNAVVAGKILPEVAMTITGTYAEFSPSGSGIRAIYRGQLGNLKSHGDPYGLELFSSKGYVTITGNVLPAVEVLGDEDTVAPVDERVLSMIQRRFKRELDARTEANYDAPPLGLSDKQIAQALEVLPKDLDYDTWLSVGMALHHETQGQGFEIWDQWSSASPKYTSREYGLARWNSFGKASSGPVVTARSLVHLANEHGAHIDLLAPASMEDFEDLSSKPAPTKPSRFAPVQVGEFASRPAPSWIVKDVLPRAELAVLYGESTAGKTFVALDLAMSIARGVEWRGKRVKQGKVVYLAAEGSGGFRNRCKAYGLHHQVRLDELPFDVIAGVPNLLLKDDALELARSIGKADVVVVDTFAQTTAGANENAAEDMGKALAHCKGIHRATGALVLLVHHAGKDASKGARGWSGLKAAADAEIEVARNGDFRMIRLTKSKDGIDSLEWGFALEVLPIELDEDEAPITSCAVVEASLPAVGAKLLRTLGPKEQIVNEVIQEMAQSQTQGIEVAAVITEAVKRLPEPTDGKRDTRKQHVKRALETLCNGDDAPYWLHDDGTIEVV